MTVPPGQRRPSRRPSADPGGGHRKGRFDDPAAVRDQIWKGTFKDTMIGDITYDEQGVCDILPLLCSGSTRNAYTSSRTRDRPEAVRALGPGRRNLGSLVAVARSVTDKAREVRGADADAEALKPTRPPRAPGRRSSYRLAHDRRCSPRFPNWYRRNRRRRGARFVLYLEEVGVDVIEEKRLAHDSEIALKQHSAIASPSRRRTVTAPFL